MELLAWHKQIVLGKQKRYLVLVCAVFKQRWSATKHTVKGTSTFGLFGLVCGVACEPGISVEAHMELAKCDSIVKEESDPRNQRSISAVRLGRLWKLDKNFTGGGHGAGLVVDFRKGEKRGLFIDQLEKVF